MPLVSPLQSEEPGFTALTLSLRVSEISQSSPGKIPDAPRCRSFRTISSSCHAVVSASSSTVQVVAEAAAAAATSEDPLLYWPTVGLFKEAARRWEKIDH